MKSIVLYKSIQGFFLFYVNVQNMYVWCLSVDLMINMLLWLKHVENTFNFH